jgi:hypothetical protein
MEKFSKVFNDAVAALNGGDLARAEKLFRRVVQANRSNVAALNLLVVVLMSLERFSEAEPFIARATSINQNSDVSFYNYGLISKRLNKPQQALEQFNRSLNLNPNVPETLNNRGTIFNDLKQYDLAVADFDRSISLNHRFGEAYVNKGKSLTLLKRYDEALTAYDKALSIKSGLAEAWLGRGNVFNELKRYDESFTAYDKALSIKSDLAEAWLGRGNVFNELKRYDEAFSAYDKALAIKPDLEGAWLGSGNVFADLKRYDEAFAAYDRALSIKPDLEGAWLGRGNVFFALNRDSEALKCLDKALDLKQDYAEARWNMALLKLSLGAYQEGWKLYEWRWRIRNFPSPSRNFSQPLWLNNSDINGKTLLIHAEQGLGDAIQFSRYLNFLANAGCKVIFEVPKPLVTLFKSQRWNCDVIAQGDDLPSFDMHCPLISLPLAFKTTIETIPSGVPYIYSSRSGALGQPKIIGESGKLKIGIVWSGNPNLANDTRRSILLKTLLPIVSESFEWFAIQKDIRDFDRSQISKGHLIKDVSSLLNDFSDTAAVISELDLVISVDTSVAHLAGALGKSVWILLPFHPDFRWLRGRTDSPWYPTARLYRQTRDGDWTDVLERVLEDLKSFARN